MAGIGDMPPPGLLTNRSASSRTCSITRGKRGRKGQSQQKSPFWGVPYYVSFTLLLLHSSVAPRRRELGPPRRFTSRSESGSTCVQQAFVREYHYYKRYVNTFFCFLRLSHPVVHSPASLDATADRLAREAGGRACAERECGEGWKGFVAVREVGRVLPHSHRTSSGSTRCPMP